MAKYLFRLDDISPQMDWEKFQRCMKIFNIYHIKPLLGVIPDNKDISISKSSASPLFWKTIKKFIEQDRIYVAQHGYQHLRNTESRGILSKRFGFKCGSEFAGLPYKEQFEKISKGKKILTSKGIKTNIFMAPNHSLDENTIKALIKARFTMITDGIALYPYYKYKIMWLPQVFWNVRNFPFGYITFCFHPNEMKDRDFIRLENFLASKTGFIEFSKVYSFKENIYSKIFNYIFSIFYIVFRFFSDNVKYIKRHIKQV